MNHGLVLWQKPGLNWITKLICQDLPIIVLNIEEIEKSGQSIDEALASEGGAIGDVRHFQINKIEQSLKEKWAGKLFEFYKEWIEKSTNLLRTAYF